MNELGFGITLDDIDAYLEKEQEKKAKNSKIRKNSKKFILELLEGTVLFNKFHAKEFQDKVIK